MRPGGRGRVSISRRPLRIVDSVDLALPGAHNAPQRARRRAAATAMGIAPRPMRAGLESFTGLPHRLELVAEIDGVAYVNDSKATNVAAAVAATRVLRRGVRADRWAARSRASASTELAGPVAERCLAV